MPVIWASEDEEFHTAECAHGAGQVVHLLAGRAGRSGWVWQARASAGCRGSLQGMADTLAAAKAPARTGEGDDGSDLDRRGRELPHD